MGDLNVETNNEKEAIINYNKAIEFDYSTTNGSAYSSLGDIYKKSKEYTKAIECYKNAIGAYMSSIKTPSYFNKDDYSTYNCVIFLYRELGDSYNDLGKWIESIFFYKKAI